MKRQHFLFLFESIFANANGDPNNGNRPRVDSETGRQIITDFRYKRTVRDYLKLQAILNHEQEQNAILFQHHYKKQGDTTSGVKTLKETLKEYFDDKSGQEKLDAMKEKFIDVRLFGGVFAASGDNAALTGPVQFAFGESLHAIEEHEIGLTSVFASNNDVNTGSMGVKHVVPYAAIITDGSINQFNAVKTGLTEEDVEKFKSALWNGTNELKTTSKNQNSLLFINLVNNEENELFAIPNMRSLVSLQSELEDTAIRSTKDYALDTTDLIDFINKHQDKFEKVEFVKHPRLTVVYRDEKVTDENISEFISISIDYKESL